MSDLIERLLAFYGLLGAAVFKEAADTIEAQAKRIAELEAENFALAAGMCIHPDKLLGDEGGTLVCTLRADLVAMTRERDVAKHNEQCTHDANKRVLKQLTATEAALTVAREALLSAMKTTLSQKSLAALGIRMLPVKPSPFSTVPPMRLRLRLRQRGKG